MIELYCKTYGDPAARPLVLLHGLFGSSTNWGSVARQLQDDFHVLVPDLRNHGRSPHDPDCSYPAMADDVRALLDRRGLDAATLVGHSMGGKVAMQLALGTPGRVAGLAVVDMSPVRYGHDFEQVLDGFDAVDLAAINARADAERAMAGRVRGAGVRAFLLQNLARGEAGWYWRPNLAALRAAQADITGFPDQPADARYGGPTTFIFGGLSDYVTAAHEPMIRRLFPAATLCEVATAGHWVYADRPREFMDCLSAFLARA